MQKRIIECVPNFSEGRNAEVIKQITDVIDAAKGVKLLDVDPGEATNRTVVTFVGEPEAVCDAAVAAIKRATELIDMRQHKGAHPRMGACDVCPLIPVSGITLEVLLAVCVPTYNVANIISAAVCTGAVTALMMVLASAKPDLFLGLGRTLFIALIVSLIVEIIATLLGYGGDIFNWIFVIIFSGYIGVDWSRAQVMSKTVDNAVDAAVQIYLDIINLFIRLLEIIGKKK